MAALRLFIALDLPLEVREGLVALPPAVRGVRVVKVENIHLTLHFIGEAEPEPIIAALEPVAASCSQFEMLLSGVGFFRGRVRSSVLWAGVEPAPELVQLHSELGAALKQLEIAVDARPFRPHITVARGERVHNEELHQFVDRHADFAALAPVESFVLYSSVLGAGGPTYTAERRFEF
ncbi:MAG: RNA 2',3'-cyclic phosphodiesterase [Aureliella sp.]